MKICCQSWGYYGMVDGDQESHFVCGTGLLAVQVPVKEQYGRWKRSSHSLRDDKEVLWVYSSLVTEQKQISHRAQEIITRHVLHS